MTSRKRQWVLSGGLASGKSSVRRLLEEHGVQTIDADSVGHRVLEPEGPAFAAVAERWPGVVAGGAIARSALAAIVFHDAAELAALESITHPHIFGTIETLVEGITGKVVVEIPRIEHRLGEDWLRLVVDCADEVRLQRAIGRGMSESDVRARMASQPKRADWLAAADVVVPNHGSPEHLRSTVARLLPIL